MKGKWSGLLISALILIGGVVYGLYPYLKPAPVYQNPVFEPVLADPSAIRGLDGFFYAYGTEDDWGDGHGPHLVPIVKSNDLIHWSFDRDAFATKPTWKSSGDIWAPDISFAGGKYYLYYAISVWGDSNPGIGVATADKPDGPFQDHGKLLDSESSGVANAIDPMKFTDDDSKAYLFFGSFHGIYGIELSADGLHTAGQPFPIAGNSYEGTYIIKRDGYYYFFGSEGSCCAGAQSGYHVAVGRSKSIRGPYVDKDGQDLKLSDGTLLLTGNFATETGPKSFTGPGHIAIVADDKGTDWMLYHAVDKANPLLPNQATRRPLMLDPLVWVDGWPTVKGMTPSTSKRKGPIFHNTS